MKNILHKSDVQLGCKNGLYSRTGEAGRTYVPLNQMEQNQKDKYRSMGEKRIYAIS